jgi:hypothetical protein
MMIGMETVLIAAAIFIGLYRLATSPRRTVNRLGGCSVLLCCAVGIPAALFGAITLLDGLHLPAIVIFVALCIVWLMFVPA